VKFESCGNNIVRL